MNSIKIGVVEDEMIITETIISALENLNYPLAGTANSYSKAIEMIEKSSPDLLLIDINLGTQKDGIDLAQYVNEKFFIPFIFLTANFDNATLNRAKQVFPIGYIPKPFTDNDLNLAIEIGLNNYQNNKPNGRVVQAFMLVKEGKTFQKIYFDEIIYIENVKNYINIYLTSDRKIFVRSTTNQIISKLPSNQFVKINRTHIVNFNYIEKIGNDVLVINDLEFPITKAIKDVLLSKNG